jgi:hypothetical protein
MHPIKLAGSSGPAHHTTRPEEAAFEDAFPPKGFMTTM